MGSKDAITLLKNVRINLGESLTDADMTDLGAGVRWTNRDLLEFLNKGKDREAEILRAARENYFQVADSITINASTKEYALASNFRKLVGIKCSTSGYETLRFREVPQDTREFQGRDSIPAGDSTNNWELIYCIIAQSKIKFADFPPTTLSVAYDYIKVLADYTLSGSSTSDLDDENAEFREAYATYKALLVYPTEKGIPVWANDIKRLEMIVTKSVSKRNQRESVYVEPY